MLTSIVIHLIGLLKEIDYDILDNKIFINMIKMVPGKFSILMLSLNPSFNLCHGNIKKCINIDLRICNGIFDY